MDGASTDGTQEIVNEIAVYHQHIRLISEKDKGQSDAMNKGIAEAKGEIISFLNVDDYYEPGVFNRILEVFKNLPEPSFVCGNLNIWNADGSLKHFNRPDKISLPELVSNLYEWPYNPTAYFYYKSLHEKTGPYNVDNHLCMDFEFILEAAKKINLIHVDEVWGNFVIVENSKTQQFHSNEAQKAENDGDAIRQRFIAELGDADLKKLNEIIASKSSIKVSKDQTFGSVIRKFKSKIKQIISQQ